MRKISRFTYTNLMLCMVLLFAVACNQATDGVADTIGIASQSAVTPEKQQPRKPVSYTNGKAKALIEKYAQCDSLSEEDYIVAMDMVQQAATDVHDELLMIVVKATSGVEMVESIGEKQAEFEVKYKYLDRLRTLLECAQESDMSDESFKRATRLISELKDKFATLENRSRLKFNETTDNTVY